MGGRGGGSSRPKAATSASPAPEPAATPSAPAPAAVVPANLEQQVLQAVESGERHHFSQDWSTLAGVRDALPGVSRDALDAELKRLSRSGRIQLSPESDQRNQTARERAARMSLGGQEQSLVRVVR